jgi:two-component system response regulator HydG
MQKVFDLAKRVSSSTATVLIRGESGTGKEVVARAIHQEGARKKQPFVAINCSAIPENLLESELFGHAKGAFTGAVDKKLGLFEEADGGTLFLDEIGDLNGGLQAKLLRVLQERKIKRIGENVFRSVDVRILAATHKNLAVEVEEKRFREDLFFRLNVIPINIPPLRDRKEDILPLAEHFLKRFSVQNNASLEGFTPAAQHLLRQAWRGNVRELENAIERAVVLCAGPKVDESDLSLADELSTKSEEVQPSSGPLEMSSVAIDELPTLAEYNLEYIEYVLKAVDGVKEQAAKILNLDRKTLYRRIKEIEESSSLKKAKKVASRVRASRLEDAH